MYDRFKIDYVSATFYVTGLDFDTPTVANQLGYKTIKLYLAWDRNGGFTVTSGDPNPHVETNGPWQYSTHRSSITAS